MFTSLARVDSVLPSVGPVFGGTRVVLHGLNLAYVSGCQFGILEAPVEFSSGSVACVSPSLPGSIKVQSSEMRIPLRVLSEGMYFDFVFECFII